MGQTNAHPHWSLACTEHEILGGIHGFFDDFRRFLSLQFPKSDSKKAPARKGIFLIFHRQRDVTVATQKIYSIFLPLSPLTFNTEVNLGANDVLDGGKFVEVVPSPKSATFGN